MYIKLIASILLALALPGVLKAQDKKGDYPDMVGNIEYDATADRTDFSLCNPNRVRQYFNGKGLQYKGEKFTLEKEIRSQYDSSKATRESGFIRIRFIVNCKGESDRFRLLAADYDYQEKTFDSSITSQLLEIVKSLNGWIPEEGSDYYQYITFKIVNGEISEILP